MPALDVWRDLEQQAKGNSYHEQLVRLGTAMTATAAEGPPAGRAAAPPAALRRPGIL